jgi:hypothetical protein
MNGTPDNIKQKAWALAAAMQAMYSQLSEDDKRAMGTVRKLAGMQSNNERRKTR